MVVEINYLTKEKILKSWLSGVAETVGKKLKIKKELSVVIVGTKKMQSLNNFYRHRDRPTDVLSFEGEGGFLGEIVLCLPVAKRQAKEHDFSLKEELAFLLIHGILHLQGYDHEKNQKEEKLMFALQEQLLKSII
ncbi:MAG TPA: rRNA maturation RNase YbeY [Candidatus Magasanikbacteria bacterium]|nr:rRNA maturation RNase YbeY [Candidatus Magasanikbacteria bacterium]